MEDHPHYFPMEDRRLRRHLLEAHKDQALGEFKGTYQQVHAYFHGDLELAAQPATAHTTQETPMPHVRPHIYDDYDGDEILVLEHLQGTHAQDDLKQEPGESIIDTHQRLHSEMIQKEIALHKGHEHPEDIDAYNRALGFDSLATHLREEHGRAKRIWSLGDMMRIHRTLHSAAGAYVSPKEAVDKAIRSQPRPVTGQDWYEGKDPGRLHVHDSRLQGRELVDHLIEVHNQEDIGQGSGDLVGLHRDLHQDLRRKVAEDINERLGNAIGEYLIKDEETVIDNTGRSWSISRSPEPNFNTDAKVEALQARLDEYKARYRAKTDKERLEAIKEILDRPSKAKALLALFKSWEGR
jgi:hypothetical protein